MKPGMINYRLVTEISAGYIYTRLVNKEFEDVIVNNPGRL